MIRISELHNEDRLNGTLTNLARGTGTAKLKIYDDSGTPQIPAAITDAPTGVLLATIVLEEPLGTIDNGVLTWALPDDALVVATGTAYWARFEDGDGNASIDCTVTDMAGAGPIKLLDVNLLAGGAVRVVEATFG